MKKTETDYRIDLILKGTIFSSRTKSLKTYYVSGMKNKFVKAICERVEKAGFSQKVALPYTLYLRNRQLNGAIGGYNDECGLYYDRSRLAINIDIENIPDGTIAELVKWVRKSTLERWRIAIQKIDAARKK